MNGVKKYRKTSHQRKSVPRHKKVCQKEQSYSRVDCIKSFNSLDASQRYLIVCKGENADIKCETCHKKFKTKMVTKTSNGH